jgi:hypothetical protein
MKTMKINSTFNQLNQMITANELNYTNVDFDAFDSKNSKTVNSSQSIQTQFVERRIHAKTRDLMNDTLWKIINENFCIRKRLLMYFDESNMNNFKTRRYENDFCFNCTKNEDFIQAISLTRVSTTKTFKLKTKSYQRLIVETTLKAWKDKINRVELADIMTIQTKRFNVILNEKIIKNINKDVTNIHIIFDFQRVVSKWSIFLLNKYVVELIELVSIVVITVVRFFQAESSQIEQMRTNQHISQFINSFFLAVITSKIVKNISFETENILVLNNLNVFVTLRHNTSIDTTIAHFKRKKVNFISLNREFSFKFSNFNFVMQLLIIKRAKNTQKNNKSRRQIVIVSNIAKRQHLNEL